VRSGAWRILVGEDAEKIDAAVRAKPEAAYDYAELFSALAERPAAGTPGTLRRRGPGSPGSGAPWLGAGAVAGHLGKRHRAAADLERAH
jgi:hypothetical protein